MSEYSKKENKKIVIFTSGKCGSGELFLLLKLKRESNIIPIVVSGKEWINKIV